MQTSRLFLIPTPSDGSPTCDRTSSPTCVLNTQLRTYNPFPPTLGSRHDAVHRYNLPCHSTQPVTSSLFVLSIEAKSRLSLHSSAHHCQRLPSSPLIENASEHLSRTNHPAPRHFRSRLTTFRPRGMLTSAVTANRKRVTLWNQAQRMAIFSDLRNPWQPYRTLSGPQTSALQTFARGSLRVQKRQGSKRPFFELRTQGLISSASVANRGKGPAISRTVG